MNPVSSKSLTEGIIPSCLKTAAIVPVYKGGGPSSPSNYRPISLTPILMKIFERVVRKQVITFMIMSLLRVTRVAAYIHVYIYQYAR